MDIALALILHPTKLEILIARRRWGTHLAEFWEFPGGKMEPGETAAQCAIREAREEVGLDVAEIDTEWEAVTYRYPERTVTLHPVLCRAQRDDAQSLASEDVRWVALDALNEFDFPPANAPILSHLAAMID